MRLTSSIVVDAEPQPIFERAARIEAWPDILPHYRFVTILEDSGNGRRTRMGAWRGWIPVTWTAIQTVESEHMVVRFRHLEGLTHGMEVQWTFQQHQPSESSPPRTLVTITHDLPPLGPWPVSPVMQRVLARQFIDHIATRTLRRIKEVVEAVGNP